VLLLGLTPWDWAPQLAASPFALLFSQAPVLLLPLLTLVTRALVLRCSPGPTQATAASVRRGDHELASHSPTTVAAWRSRAGTGGHVGNSCGFGAGAAMLAAARRAALARPLSVCEDWRLLLAVAAGWLAQMAALAYFVASYLAADGTWLAVHAVKLTVLVVVGVAVGMALFVHTRADAELRNTLAGQPPGVAQHPLALAAAPVLPAGYACWMEEEGEEGLGSKEQAATPRASHIDTGGVAWTGGRGTTFVAASSKAAEANAPGRSALLADIAAGGWVPRLAALKTGAGARGPTACAGLGTNNDEHNSGESPRTLRYAEHCGEDRARLLWVLEEGDTVATQHDVECGRGNGNSSE
jgi:hypothetical protein